MLKDSLGATYRKVIFLQALLAGLFALIAWATGGQLATTSAICGGAAVVAGSLVYAMIARESKVKAVSGKHVFTRHALAEVAKIVVMLGAMFSAYASGWFAAGWLLAAMGVALMGHILAMLFIK